MANGNTHVFEDGKLKEIISIFENIDEEVAEISDTIEDLEDRIEELEAEVLLAQQLKRLKTVKNY